MPSGRQLGTRRGRHAIKHPPGWLTTISTWDQCRTPSSEMVRGRSLFLGDRQFESVSLQRRVHCEPGVNGTGVPWAGRDHRNDLVPVDIKRRCSGRQSRPVNRLLGRDGWRPRPGTSEASESCFGCQITSVYWPGGGFAGFSTLQTSIRRPKTVDCPPVGAQTAAKFPVPADGALFHAGPWQPLAEALVSVRGSGRVVAVYEFGRHDFRVAGGAD
jgi:hypothetical protein